MEYSRINSEVFIELSRTVRVSRSCAEDEGRPLDIGLHELVSNPPERLFLKGLGRERQDVVTPE